MTALVFKGKILFIYKAEWGFWSFEVKINVMKEKGV